MQVPNVKQNMRNPDNVLHFKSIVTLKCSENKTMDKINNEFIINMSYLTF